MAGGNDSVASHTHCAFTSNVTLHTIIPTSVGEVSIGLSLNAVWCHWVQEGCLCGHLAGAAQTGSFCTCGGLCHRWLGNPAASGGLRGLWCHVVPGCGPRWGGSRRGSACCGGSPGGSAGGGAGSCSCRGCCRSSYRCTSGGWGNCGGCPNSHWT